MHTITSFIFAGRAPTGDHTGECHQNGRGWDRWSQRSFGRQIELSAAELPAFSLVFVAFSHKTFCLCQCRIYIYIYLYIYIYIYWKSILQEEFWNLWLPKNKPVAFPWVDAAHPISGGCGALPVWEQAEKILPRTPSTCFRKCARNRI